MKEPANHVELFPVFVLRFHQHQHQVRADGKVLTLVADDQADKILLDFVERNLQHLQRVAAYRIHFRMKLETGDAVAEIDQRRTRILPDDCGGRGTRILRVIHGRDAHATIFQRLQNDHAGRISRGHVLAGGKVEMEPLAIFLFVERLRARVEHLLHIRRNRLALFLQLRD